MENQYGVIEWPCGGGVGWEVKGWWVRATGRVNAEAVEGGTCEGGGGGSKQEELVQKGQRWRNRRRELWRRKNEKRKEEELETGAGRIRKGRMKN